MEPMRRRVYSADEAMEFAGTPRDVVAQNLYRSSAMIWHSVHVQHTAPGGDNMLGVLWNSPDGKVHVWIVQLDGFLRYAGHAANAVEAHRRFLAPNIPTATRRATTPKAPRPYRIVG